MLLLAFDTAGPQCAVAVARGARNDFEILAQAGERLGLGHAERLLPMIEDVLEQAGVTFCEVERVAVTTGPGSFTGVRVGVAAARGLALALGIPAVGIGSLQALASETTRSCCQGTAVAVLEAKRDEVYAFVQDSASGAVLLGPTAIKVEHLAAGLAGVARPLILTGTGSRLLQPALNEAACEVIGTGEAPDIASVIDLGFRARPEDRAVPLYLRGPDAKPQAGKAVGRA